MVAFISAITTVAGITSLVSAYPQPQQSSSAKVEQLYQDAKGTWYENLAVRANGNVLVTAIGTASVFEFAAPIFSSPKTVAHIDSLNSTTGIAEYAPDRFAFIAANFSFATGNSPGSSSLWSLDLSNDAPQVSELGSLPNATLANGLAYAPGCGEQGLLLYADSLAGVVGRFDLATKQSSSAIDSPLFKQPPGSGPLDLGVNGLKYVSPYLYFTNSAQGLFGRVALASDGSAASEPEVLVNQTSTPYKVNDDFTVKEDGMAYVAGGVGNVLLQLGPGKQQELVVAGGQNSTVVDEPSSVAFARGEEGCEDEKVLFVTTGGGLGEGASMGAQLLRVTLRA